ncbi:MAG: universal stress protein, partial [Demequina sp.]
MTEITHVLAGVELSHASSDAMVRAAQVARESRARLTVLHALGWEAPSVVQALLGLDTDHLTRDSTVKATAQLARRLAELDIVGTDVEQAIETGVPGPTIASSCRERAADLVVIGDRVSSRVHRALFGSTSSYLLRTSSVPVLVVKSPADRHYRDVLIAVDFSPASVRSV